MSSEKQEELDQTRSGIVEYLKGADGKLRAYVRKVDHDAIVDKIIQAVRKPNIDWQ